MGDRAFHPAGFFSSYLIKTSQPIEEHPLLKRCLDPLLKHILPTVLMLVICSVVALYLGELVEQTKQAHRQAKLAEAYAVVM